MTDIDDEDKKIWQQALENVTPLAKQPHIHFKAEKKFNTPKAVKNEMEIAPTALFFHDNDEDQGESIFFARPGLQSRLQQQLRSGKLRPQASLDLHGFTVNEAREAVAQFLTQARLQKYRIVTIIHGKGHLTGAKLRNKVYQWLPQCQAVLAVCSTIAREGGTGAVYVLLRVKQ